MRIPLQSLLVLFLAVLCAATGAEAAWVSNGIFISSGAYNLLRPKVVSDDAGGAIFAWLDYRGIAPGYGIYAQRVDGYGNELWTPGGAAVQTGGLNYGWPEAAPDGVGGAIVVFNEGNGQIRDLFAQRIDASGAPLWGSDGVTICNAATQQRNYHVVPDGFGGAVIAWQDSSAGGANIYAQRVDADGNVLWTANGVAICVNTFEQHEPRLAPDGLGGAFIVWDDHRNGPSDIYAQRVNAAGTVEWVTNGQIVCSSANAQQDQCIVSDGAGNAIMAWRDYRNSANWILYAQKMLANGTADWTANGVLACTTVVNMYYPAMTTDMRNGAILAWAMDGAVDQDIFAQRISYLGYREWNAGGNVVCDYTATQSNCAIVSDRDGGAVIAWQDYRPGTTRDIYAQRILSDGSRDWTTSGVALCGAAQDQINPAVATDGEGGVIATWEDYRVDGVTSEVYAQRIERYGHWGYPCAVITDVADVLADQGGYVTVTWQKSRLETTLMPLIPKYSIWRQLPIGQVQAILARGAKTVDRANLGAAAPGDIYLSTASGAAEGWELLEYVTATVSPTYTRTEPTLYDYADGIPGLHYFMVMTHGISQFIFWESQPDSGFSMDNIVPAQPVNFAAVQSFDPIGLLLSWGDGAVGAAGAVGAVKALGTLTDSDFSHYALYRDVTPRFLPGPENCIYEGPDTTYFDGEWRWNSGFYYRLAAVDIHGNHSTFGLITPDDVTGTETPRTPAASYLAQNAPNPFNPSTTIEFGLASPARVTLSIYDVSGRLIRTLIEEPRAAGVYKQPWDGRDAAGRAVASGVYFYRLRAGAFTDTKKLVLAR